MSGPGRVALVTGAGTGIGRAIAQRLSRDGFRVAVNVRKPGAGEETLAGVADGIEVVADVTVPEDVARMVAETEDRLGPIHVAVNNAGMQSEVPFLEMSYDDWRSQVAVDLDGVFLVANAAARRMAPRGAGVIINISSVHEHIPRQSFAAYCSSKAGVGMLTRCIALELAPRGIRCVSVAPGAIATAMNQEAQEDEQARRKVEAEVPAGRIAAPEEVAGLVAWLASDEAAYVTGTTYVIDGGLETQVVAH